MARLVMPRDRGPRQRGALGRALGRALGCALGHESRRGTLAVALSALGLVVASASVASAEEVLALAPEAVAEEALAGLSTPGATPGAPPGATPGAIPGATPGATPGAPGEARDGASEAGDFTPSDFTPRGFSPSELRRYEYTTPPPERPAPVASVAPGRRVITLSPGTSETLTLAEDVDTALVANPETADVTMLDSRQVLVLGKAPGVTSLELRGLAGVLGAYTVRVDAQTYQARLGCRERH